MNNIKQVLVALQFLKERLNVTTLLESNYKNSKDNLLPFTIKQYTLTSKFNFKNNEKLILIIEQTGDNYKLISANKVAWDNTIHVYDKNIKIGNLKNELNF